MNQRQYEKELFAIIGSIPKEKRSSFIEMYSYSMKNPLSIFGFSAFYGHLGIDRFLLGHPVLGVIKAITLGGLVVWSIVDLFLVGGITRQQNIQLAKNIASSI